MKYRTLGNTDLTVSRICFGCWQLSPRFWGDVGIAEWRKALDVALGAGINFIDTANAYGEGYAESQLGEWFKETGKRDEFVLATKFYWNFETAERFPDTQHDHILRACEDSLKRLKTDRIDLYQIHSWDELTRPDEVAAALLRLRKEGKVRYFGVSNLNVEQIELYRAWFPVDSLQPPYSLLARDIEARELPHCLRHNIGVMAYSPLFRGLLTGKHRGGDALGDSRDNLVLFKGKPLAAILEGLDSIAKIGEQLGLTLPQLVIRWVLTHPALTCAILGVKKASHIESILPAVEAPLEQSVWHKIADTMADAHKKALEA